MRNTSLKYLKYALYAFYVMTI